MKLHRIIAALLCVAMLAAMCPQGLITEVQAATSGTCGDNLTWTLSNSGVLTISGSGAMTDYSNYSAVAWYANVSSITSVVIKSGVTTIGKYAFYKCNNLTSVTIPSSVTSIGTYAFYNCAGITKITLPSYLTTIGARAFYGCSGLTQITIPSRVTTIEERAFYGCNGLTEVTVPAGVTNIGDYIFLLCKGLNEVTFSEGVTKIGAGMFYNCSALAKVTIPDGMVSIGNSAFSGCAFSSITIPRSVQSIGDGAFSYCSALADVYYSGSQSGWNAISIGESNTQLTDATIHYAVPANGICGSQLTWTLDEEGTLTVSGTGEMTDFLFVDSVPWDKLRSLVQCVVLEPGVTSIGSYAFADCTDLLSVTSMEQVTSIGYRAFDGCTNLSSEMNLAQATEIDAFAFRHCEGLTKLTLSEGLTTIGDAAFVGCAGLTSVNIPKTVSSIGNNVFSSCTALTEVTISEGVTSIGDSAFESCSGLISVTIPAGVTSIGNRAFFGCSGLTSATIPAGVTSIGNYVFFNCGGLKSVTIPGSVTSIGTSAFYCCSSLTDVYYTGTQDQWNAITISTGNDPLTAAILHYGLLCGDDLRWELDQEGTLTIKGSGEMGAYTSGGAPWYESAADIKTVIIQDGATSIGSYAFEGCANLTRIAIPASLTGIGSAAFSSCTGLTDVYFVGTQEQWNAIAMAEGNELLLAATVHIQERMLTGIAMRTNPTKITYLPNEDLDTTGLTLTASYHDGTTATIAEGFTVSGFRPTYTGSQQVTVTYGAYTTSFTVRVRGGNGCGENVYWEVSAGTLYIFGKGDMYHYGDSMLPWREYKESVTAVVVESGVTSIGAYAFDYMTGIKSVVLPNTLTQIGAYAFRFCNLGSVTIPQSMTSIGDCAFAYSSLDEITIPEGVTSIGDSAFLYCDFTGVTIPSSVTSIGIGAFESCNYLTFNVYDNGKYLGNTNNAYHAFIEVVDNTLSSFTIHEDTKMIASFAFCGCKLETVDVPKGITRIPERAFEYCSALTSITIPDTVTSIGKRAFYGCTALTDISIPEGIAVIEQETFYECSSMKSFTIPVSVTNIGDGAFYKCTSLTDVYYDDYESVWNKKVTIGTFNEPLTSATLHTKPTKLTGISIKTQPTKTVYIQGESLDTTGLVLSAAYDNGDAVDVTEGFTVSGFDPESVGQQTVTVAYEGATTTFTVIVNRGGSCGDALKWMLDDGVLNIFGTGAMADYEMQAAPWYVYADEIRSVVMESGVTTVGACAFYGCANMTELTLPDTVTSLAFLAFGNCVALTQVTIPAGVTTMGVHTFSGCNGLTGFVVDENNTAFANDAQGVLFNKSMTQLWKAPAALPGSYTVPDGVHTIGENAFEGCAALTDLTLPEGVGSTGSYAFSGCTGLTTVAVPESLTLFNDGAFQNCSSLETVFYCGTQEQKSAITIGGASEPLENAQWLCSVIFAEDDLQAVLDEAPGGATVVMTQDVSARSVQVWDDVTLVLGDNTLTVDYFTCFGSVIEAGDGGNGLVKANKDIHIAGDNSFLPIYDSANSGYRFYKYELQNLGFKAVAGNDDAVMLGIRLSLNNAAGYDVLATTTDEAMDVLTYLNWQGLPVPLAYIFQDDTLRSYASQTAADLAANGISTKAIILTVSGISKLETGTDFTTQPAVATAPGVTGQAGSLTWTVQ